MSDFLTAFSAWRKNHTQETILHPRSCIKQFFGRRIYLAIDRQGNCTIRYLNFLQRLVRKLFGCFKETHRKVLLNRLQKLDKEQIQDQTTLKIVAYFEARLKTPLFLTGADPRKNRRTPQLALCDTIVFKNGKPVGAHDRGIKLQLFQDQEILQVHQVIRKQLLDGEREQVPFGFEWHPIYAEFTANQKAIIQQGAMRGCTAAATAMLILDSGKQCDVGSLRGRNIGQTMDMRHDIAKAGLTPVISHCQSLSDLKEQIQKHGSAIISISGEIGGHVIVVDAIESDRARIRDPFHGWEITIKLDALKSRFSNGNHVIQVKKYP
ncbi:MAG: hypothetical protein LLG04_00680 [Parachlamydia sp.]|nr:hypothetical protein [Parachlamydia sp.]